MEEIEPLVIEKKTKKASSKYDNFLEIGFLATAMQDAKSLNFCKNTPLQV